MIIQVSQWPAHFKTNFLTRERTQSDTQQLHNMNYMIVIEFLLQKYYMLQPELYLYIAVSSCDDLKWWSILFTLKDHGIVTRCQQK